MTNPYTVYEAPLNTPRSDPWTQSQKLALNTMRHDPQIKEKEKRERLIFPFQGIMLLQTTSLLPRSSHFENSSTFDIFKSLVRILDLPKEWMILLFSLATDLVSTLEMAWCVQLRSFVLEYKRHFMGH